MVEGRENSKTLLIKDLVEMPDIRTVIQLEDLTDPNLRRLILDTFVITGEVLESLKAVLKGLSELNRDFSRFYEKALPGWEQSGKPGPVMVQDIPRLLSKKRGVPDHNRVVYLLMDGMRWDLWEKIKRDFFARMPPPGATLRSFFGRLAASTKGSMGKRAAWSIFSAVSSGIWISNSSNASGTSPPLVGGTRFEV